MEDKIYMAIKSLPRKDLNLGSDAAIRMLARLITQKIR